MRAAPNTFLSTQQLFQAAPSIFAQEPWHKMSDRYTFVPTFEVLAQLEQEDFVPVMATQSRTRIPGKSEFTKHLIRLRRRDDLITKAVGDIFPEVLLTNSHDGVSTYDLEGGLWRLVCSNGMVCGESSQRIKVRHKGNIGGEIIDGCISIIDDALETREHMLSWRDIQLSESEQNLFARTALSLKYDDPTSTPITPTAINRPRRYEDRGNSLFLAVNRVQEALTKGGVRGVASSGRRMTTREVSSIAENIKLNRAIMTLGEEFARRKTGS